jgi:ATP-dependent exoDNAse (exonuclease V) alpha subunit
MAYNYQEGDAIRFTRGSQQFAIPKGSYGRVEAIDRDANVLTVTTTKGQRTEYNPARLFGVEVFREDQRVLAPGERIQFRVPDRALGIANGEFATIKSIDSGGAVVRLDGGRELRVASDRLRHIDYGYASTSHSAQGATVDRVIVDIDTRLSPELINRKQLYVSISRARKSLAIYTDDRAQLPRAASRSREKSTAIQHSTPRPRHGFTIAPDGNRQSLSHSHGIRR